MNVEHIAIIGAGRLARFLAKKLISKHPNRYRISQIYSLSEASSHRIKDDLGQGEVFSKLDDGFGVGADWLWLAVPDDLIDHVCRQWVKQFFSIERSYAHRLPRVIHFSGILSLKVLHAAHDQGCEVGNIHPAFSFASEGNPDSFEGTWCSYQYLGGNADAWLEKINHLGGVPYLIQDSQKEVYHTALSMASGLLVSLLDATHKILECSGIPIDCCQKIAQQTLSNLNHLTTEQSFTGPLKRGDEVTLKKHLNVLDRQHPEIASVYRALAGHALTLCAHHSVEKHQKLDELLQPPNLRKSTI
jgi:predicted short-subunit dehydrogenase-like oxidoreductase (DUF2520 family)